MRRLIADVKIQAGIGAFFADKLRSAVYFAMYERNGDLSALADAVAAYRGARDAWIYLVVKNSADVYTPDVTAGEHTWLRGHWSNRLAAIDEDIALMAARARGAALTESPSKAFPVPRNRARGREARHTISAARLVELDPARMQLASARLYYRHVTQAERWQSLEMRAEGGRYRAQIPEGYRAPYPLQYYFELRTGDEAWLYPGLGADLAQQPYSVFEKA